MSYKEWLLKSKSFFLYLINQRFNWENSFGAFRGNWALSSCQHAYGLSYLLYFVKDDKQCLDIEIPSMCPKFVGNLKMQIWRKVYKLQLIVVKAFATESYLTSHLKCMILLQRIYSSFQTHKMGGLACN